MCSHDIQNIQLKTKQYFILDNIGTKIIKIVVYEWYSFNRITGRLYLLFVLCWYIDLSLYAWNTSTSTTEASW